MKKRKPRQPYEEYLASPHWRRRRLEVMERESGSCVCGDVAVVVHHRSYRNLGAERDEDLLAVCVKCHDAIHDLQRSGVRLALATDYHCAVVMGLSRPVLPVRKKAQRRRKRRERRPEVDVITPGVLPLRLPPTR